VKIVPAVACVLALASPPAAATLEDGLGLLRRGDVAEAYEVLRKAAVAGDARAARALGAMLERDIQLSRGRVSEAKPDQAAGWYLRAFEGGDKPSADALGLMFYQGRGVERNFDESLRWYRHNQPVDTLLRSVKRVAEADRAEAASWWFSVKTVMSREMVFPRSAAVRNSWGTVEVHIDAAKRTVTLAKSDAVAAIEDEATKAAESALRQLPPPKAAVDAQLVVIIPVDFQLVGP
jgi:hypothetical protein